MNGQLEITWESVAETHAGKVRSANEDAVLNRRDAGLWAVADGMGGHYAGAEASKLVVDSLAAVMPNKSLEELASDVEQALKDANASLIRKARESGNGISGSTAAVLISVGDRAAAIWVGDSRVYRSREGRLEQISRDHSQLEEWIAMGLLDRDDVDSHPPSNIITRAIGAEDLLDADIEMLDVCPGDTYLVCSDGLYNEVPDDEIAQYLSGGRCVQAARQLLDLALARGARDNVSLIVAHAHADDDDETRTLINPSLSVS